MARNALTLPYGLTGEIIRLAGGNPFFIEEVVKSLFDQGVIVRRERGLKVTEKASTITIPATITDVLTARIDRLEEPTKQLVKVSSVIGRSFSARILSDVASEVEDIPGRLSFLTQTEILQPQEQMGEVNYTFSHALAQEAAYESILPSRRRELHLKVALSIEKIFSSRLPEYYGMLAYHYGRAEDLEKTEEYLIKAGEEALRSAASDEALHYYEDALQLYLKKSGPDANPEKVAMLEKNIALALYNRGQHQEAIQHFDKALHHYWGKLPKGPVFVAAKLFSALVHLLMALYLPFLKFRKMPTERDIEIVDLFFKKVNSLSLTNAKRFFIEYFYLFRFISSFDLRKFKEGYGIFVMASALFAYSGISFALSRKALEAVKNSVSDNDVINYTAYEICETVHDFLGGNWKALKDYDDDFVEKNCRIGEIYEASQYLYWQALGNICQGSFDKAGSIVSRLNDLFEVYGNDLSKTFKYEVNTWLLIESGRLDEAMIESEKGLDFEDKVHSGWWDLHICQASIHIMLGAIQKAQECLERADRIRLQTETAPFQLSTLFKTRLELDLYRLKEATRSGDRSQTSELQTKGFKSMRSLEKVARRVAYHRTDTYRLAGGYYWAINKHEKALRRWHRAVQEGDRMGAKPQLARLYFDVGRCLLEDKGKTVRLDGLDGEACLGKARALFVGMNVASRLEEIDRLMGTKEI
jgi:tetratricopeptide (TPR) repeat protein